MFGRRRRDDDLRSTGLIKWVNKFCRFVLFPFIHPIKFVVFLVVLAVIALAVPLYYGVQFKEIPSWYVQMWHQYYQRTETAVQDNVIAPVKEEAANLQQSVGYDITVKTVEKKPSKADMVSYATPQSVNRKLFEKAQDVPVDIKATVEVASIAKTVQVKPQFKPIKGLDLAYLDEPKEEMGRAVILNPNEIMVNGTVMFLYGIYTSPSSAEGREAMHYLKNNIEGKEINCWIGAYTQENVPAVICFYNNISINQRLIDLKFAKNVGLN